MRNQARWTMLYNRGILLPTLTLHVAHIAFLVLNLLLRNI